MLPVFAVKQLAEQECVSVRGAVPYYSREYKYRYFCSKSVCTFFQAVTNFVMYKFGSLRQVDWQMMYDLAKMFLYCFNHWKLETPSVHARSTTSDNQRNYKEIYSRYVCIHVCIQNNCWKASYVFWGVSSSSPQSQYLGNRKHVRKYSRT